MDKIDLRKVFYRETNEVVRISPIEGGIWFTDKYVKWLEKQILDKVNGDSTRINSPMTESEGNKKNNMKGDTVYILEKDIVIPAGTKFDNYDNIAKEQGYFEAVVGIGKDCVEFLRIRDMDEILKHEPQFFRISGTE